MERLEKKKIKGKTYYYYSKWEKIDGKCKRVWQKYLGNLENILKTFENNEPANPQYAEIFQYGLTEVLWNECSIFNIINDVNSVCQKRNQGLSVGDYIAIAAINRAIRPVSKSRLFDWFSKTTLRRHTPVVNKTTLSHQRPRDHMDRIEPQMALLIWKKIITEVIQRENIDLNSISYFGPNFYTFIDTFNAHCDIAKLGKNKQGRSNLRQISYALFCSADGQIPLYYEIYEGNRNVTSQFSLMLKNFHDFIKTSWGKNISSSELTLIFDKGNNSKDNFQLIDSLKIHYVGSVKLSEFKSLAEISNKDSRFITSTHCGLESTKSLRVQEKAYGKLRDLVVTYNQKLFDTQILTVYNDIENAIEKLAALEQKLKDRASGLVTKGKPPKVTSVESQCKNILARQYMIDLIPL